MNTRIEHALRIIKDLEDLEQSNLQAEQTRNAQRQEMPANTGLLQTPGEIAYGRIEKVSVELITLRHTVHALREALKIALEELRTHPPK